jgi:hypothetical protein
MSQGTTFEINSIIYQELIMIDITTLWNVAYDLLNPEAWLMTGGLLFSIQKMHSGLF